MTQRAIRYWFFRGGSSRGPFFHRADLPADRDALSAVLTAVLGSGHPLNIDGLGGGSAVTTKVAMLSRAADDRADVEYFFAQVGVEDGRVDYRPTCGNIMVAVGPAAIEMGLVTPRGDVTEVNIHAVNTGARVTARVQTPGGVVRYDGATVIDGVPGSAAPVGLDFTDITGSVTGRLFPTGRVVDTIDGVDVSGVDLAMPMVIARARDFGLSGYESRDELDANREFFERMESIRLAAAERMGMGDCSRSVTPKFGLLAPAAAGGALAARYFMPWATHPTLAVTGSLCLAACALTPGSVADGLLGDAPRPSPARLLLEHPMGMTEVVMRFSDGRDGIEFQSGGVIRTARKLAQGEVFVPAAIWR